MHFIFSSKEKTTFLVQKVVRVVWKVQVVFIYPFTSAHAIVIEWFLRIVS